MIASETARVAESVALLAQVREKGVRIWSDQGQLRYRAPQGALTHVEMQRLRDARDAIVALLEDTEATTSVTDPRLEYTPLTFTQQTYWELYQLRERPARRQVASATRVRGPLHVDALRRSLAEVVRRHSALRTRIVLRNGAPMQEVAPFRAIELPLNDLSAFSAEAREAEVKRLLEADILAPIDVTIDPLFGLRLLQLEPDEHVLLLVMEHIISDACSMNILLHDLFTAHAQTVAGLPCSLPEVPVQLADYAIWQRSVGDVWLARHRAYWQERLSDCARLRFPPDHATQMHSRTGWARVPIRIGKAMKDELREWCRLKHTTLVMGVFTAFAALVLRWCNASEAVLQYESDGRVSHKLEHTIGYFASALYLRIRIDNDDGFLDLLQRVTREYCCAYEHADFSYLVTQGSRPDFARNSVFNWVSRGPLPQSTTAVGSTSSGVTLTPIYFEHPGVETLEADNEPSMLLFDADDEIVGGVFFPRTRFSPDVMAKFTRNFDHFLAALVRSSGRVTDIALL